MESLKGDFLWSQVWSSEAETSKKYELMLGCHNLLNIMEIFSTT